MEGIFTASAVVAVVVSMLALVRLAIGQTVFDRLLAAGAIGTNAIAFLVLTGFIFNRPDMFVDLALTYALLNFVGAVAVGKYLERYPRDETDEDYPSSGAAS